jgi:deoxyribodipyrimidine photo-lyase
MTSHQHDTGLMWFRRDLRTADNAALYHALKSCRKVYCVFVFDKEILDHLPAKDRRVEFIHDSVTELSAKLQKLSSHGKAQLIVRHAWANTEIPQLAQALKVNAVFANHDYEPQAIARDEKVRLALAAQGQTFHTFKDHVIFEKQEVLTLGAKPFSVFSPYKNAWFKKLDAYQLKAYPSEAYAESLAPIDATHAPNAQQIPSLEDMGFESTGWEDLKLGSGETGGQAMFDAFTGRMQHYDETRNYPAVKGPSYLGVHFRFGTVAIRSLARIAFERQQRGDTGASTWLNELVWRDFYFQILANNPHAATRSFKPEYDRIQWETGQHAQDLFAAWCEGRTGFPIVDAAMAQINQSGYMHNRLRMIVASFLTKDLGLDWRWGERYFAEKLNDFDLAANNGGWQWASSSGCDAQPYFRIFNPKSQSEKFDSQGKFIRRYIPALAELPDKDIHAPELAKPLVLQAAKVHIGKNYPYPVVQHDQARLKTLERYAVVKKS